MDIIAIKPIKKLNRISFRRLIFFSVLLFAVVLHAQQLKQSSLWGPNGDDWDPAGRLPDFSYAGYHSSAKDLPTGVRVVANLRNDTNANPNDTNDDSQALKNLINAQNTTAANPGVIEIPAGRWVINNPFSFNKSGIILKGAVDANGRPTTEFYFPRSHPTNNRQWFIHINGNHNRNKLGTVSSNASQGAKTFSINYSGGTRFAVGDMIQLVQNDPGNRSLSEYLHAGQSMDEFTTSNAFFPDVFYFYAIVTEVSGNSITFDRHLPVDVRTSWNPEVFKFNPNASTSEIGFENIKFTCNNNKAFRHGRPVSEEPGFLILRFSKVVNCWMKNIEMIDADGGVRFDTESCFNTVRDIVFEDVIKSLPYPKWEDRSNRGYIYDCQQRAGAGHHPITAWHAYYNLFEQFEFKDPYWHELSVEGAAAYNVFRDGKGIAVAFDNHAWMPYSNCWTNIDIGRQERLWFNSGQGVRGYKAGFRNTYWNITYDYVEQRNGIERAEDLGFRQLNLIGYARGQGGHSSHLVEVTGVNERIAQEDIFIAQLCKRGACNGGNQLPSGTFASPTFSTIEEGYDQLYVRIDASDPDGDPDMDQVDVTLRIDGNDIRTEFGAPYEFGNNPADPDEDNTEETLNLPPGDHLFEAVIVDAEGGRTIIAKTITVTEKGVTLVSPIHDAYIEGTTGYNDIDLKVENGNRTTYLQFDISDFTEGEIVEASLELAVGGDEGMGTIILHEGNQSSWTEQGINASNAPEITTFLDQKNTTYPFGQTFVFDVMNADFDQEKLTIIIQMPNTGDDDVWFASKENNQFTQPILRIKTSEPLTTNEFISSGIKIYPNPVKGRLYITSSTPKDRIIKVYDLLGIEKISKPLAIEGAEIDLSPFANGIYMVKIINADKSSGEQLFYKVVKTN